MMRGRNVMTRRNLMRIPKFMNRKNAAVGGVGVVIGVGGSQIVQMSTSEAEPPSQKMLVQASPLPVFQLDVPSSTQVPTAMPAQASTPTRATPAVILSSTRAVYRPWSASTSKPSSPTFVRPTPLPLD